MTGISIMWNHSINKGTISIRNADIESGRLSAGQGLYDNSLHQFHTQGPARLELTIRDEHVDVGAFATLITVQTDSHGFSFFLRDVSSEFPIYIREYGVVVTEANHSGSYEQIAAEIMNRGLQTNLQQIESDPEQSYESAARATRSLTTPVWLGLSRDVRIFEAGFRGQGDCDLTRQWDWIRAGVYGQFLDVPELNNKPVLYNYLLGRGLGCEYRLTRRLENGIYPIVHCTIVDDDIQYNNVAFSSYESSPLHASTLRGTYYLIADEKGLGHMFTDRQQEEYEKRIALERPIEEETVYYSQTIAINKGKVPRYAWFKSPFARKVELEFDGEEGFNKDTMGKVFTVSKLNGKPLPQEEVAILLMPGESVVFEFYIPHSPITEERAALLREQDFQHRFQECLAFWEAKLSNTMEIKLPEPRIQEMMQAGFMHLDLISYGLEPDHTLVPTIGAYTAIGSESSPIIQYLDSIGAHHNAERSLQFFLDKQHENGFIQNFGGYMLETGAALWSMGEHYRYVRDDGWVNRIKPNLVKAYEFLLAWRSHNLREELIGNGYGMLEGKTADPEDHFRSYMLNGFAYIGLKRLAEMLESTDPLLSDRILQDANDLKRDIRTSLRENMAKSPVVPLGDGSWVPTCAPWAEYRGPLSLYADGGKWGTHGSMVARDSLIGPLYLVLQEVLDPDGQEASFLLHFHNELMCMQNVALSQPYYSVHPLIHLRRGETKPFLAAFYHGLAGLADREIYTFWEHYWHASPHKTHEEGWFLMQCRWMLYMEDGQKLRLLPGIPRAWMEQGKRVSIGHAASYFGQFSMEIESDIANGRITANIHFHSSRAPEVVDLRLPHPEGKRALRVSNGTYDSAKETVCATVSGSMLQVIVEF
jgi:hypothetical protein